MSQDFDETNRFTLSKNTQKREGKRDADYRGSINVNGQEFWLNGWITNSKNGPFISGSIRPKEPKQEREPEPAQRARHEPRDMDDKIPF